MHGVLFYKKVFKNTIQYIFALHKNDFPRSAWIQVFKKMLVLIFFFETFIFMKFYCNMPPASPHISPESPPFPPLSDFSTQSVRLQ